MKKIIPFSLWFIFLAIYTYRLLQFPIFEDEAELLFFAEKIIANPLANLFISMHYGPLPALSWLVALISLFTGDTLLGGRLLNVLLAASLLWWVYLITKLYNLPRRFYIFSSLLLIFSPILLLNARVALWDTSVMVFSAWYIYLFLLAFKKPKYSTFILLFILMLFSFLIKFTSFFALPGLLLLLIINYWRGRNRQIIHKLLLVILLSSVVSVFFIYSFKNSVIADAGTSLIIHNSGASILAKIHNNVWLYINWFRVYYPLYLVQVIIFAYAIFRYKKEKPRDIIIVLFIWFVTSSLMMILFNRFFYPRHLLILVLPIMVVTSYYLLKVPFIISLSLISLIIASRLVLFNQIIVDYYNADMAKEDRFQYFEDYTSGVNIDDISRYLTDLSLDKKIVVWLDGSWVVEYGLRRNLKNNPNVLFKSFVKNEGWEFSPPEAVAKNSFGVNYVVVNKREPSNIKLFSLIREFRWKNHKSQYLYQVK